MHFTVNLRPSRDVTTGYCEMRARPSRAVYWYVYLVDFTFFLTKVDWGVKFPGYPQNESAQVRLLVSTVCHVLTPKVQDLYEVVEQGT